MDNEKAILKLHTLTRHIGMFMPVDWLHEYGDEMLEVIEYVVELLKENEQTHNLV